MAATTSPSSRPASSPTTAWAPDPDPAVAHFKLLRGTRGFWRIAQDPGGVWWFVSPENQAEFLNTVTTVQPYQLARDPDGPSFVSRDWDGGATANGDVDRWANATLARVRSAGFKGLGAWCHPAFHKLNVPITRDLNTWNWISGSARRFYSPDWASSAEKAIATQVSLLRDNRHLIGYYTDNELDWGDAASGPAVYFDHLPPDDPNRRQVIAVIRTVWSSIAAFNQDWGTELRDWKDLDALVVLPHEPSSAYGRLFSAWLSRLAEDYFRLTSTLVRKHDPNHLILGVRFKGQAPLEAVRASRNWTDAQSINYYVADARLDAEQFQMMHEQSRQPIIVSEYSFHALDGRTGNRNTFGFAAQVLDQQARADAYRLFTTRLARVPYIIGGDWFQWSDEPPSGRSYDGEDVNFGVVDVDDRPYDLLVASIRRTTPLLNSLHASSHSDKHADVWRESFARKPTATVPMLATPIRLNGELSDWPANAKFQGIRHSQTVGLERSPLPLPNVYLGWTEQGLYLGMEVFDNDIDGAPAKGWWWTKDCVEWWLSTRPVSDDQNGYDAYCHQFFFVPQDPSSNNGTMGVVGRWHRPGDGLADSLIPHPEARSVVRLLADRYVVEVFIPTSAMRGFEPAQQRAMAFNLHIRNYQHATDYFWSAPKEVLTQTRPNTWGRIVLIPTPPAAARAQANKGPPR